MMWNGMLPEDALMGRWFEHEKEKEEKKMSSMIEENPNHVVSIIQILAEECNKIATEHGFWEDENDLISALNDDELDWRRLERKERILSLFNSEKIALEMSELAERLETL